MSDNENYIKPTQEQISAMAEWMAGTMTYQELWEFAYRFCEETMEERPEAFWENLKDYGLELEDLYYE